MAFGMPELKQGWLCSAQVIDCRSWKAWSKADGKLQEEKKQDFIVKTAIPGELGCVLTGKPAEQHHTKHSVTAAGVPSEMYSGCTTTVEAQSECFPLSANISGNLGSCIFCPQTAPLK